MIREESTPVLQVQEPGELPLVIRERTDVEDVDDEDVAGFRALDLDGPLRWWLGVNPTSRMSLAPSSLTICPPVQSRHSTRNFSPGTDADGAQRLADRLVAERRWSKVGSAVVEGTHEEAELLFGLFPDAD